MDTNSYFPINKVGKTLQTGGIKLEELNTKFEANNRTLLVNCDSRYVNEDGMKVLTL